MVDRDAIDPHASALVVFDLLEGFRAEAEAADVIAPVAGLIDACRDREVPIVYASAAHRPDGADYGRTLTDTDRDHRPFGRNDPPPARYRNAGARRQVLAELAPQDGDYVIEKHRWNAFFQTPLELSLRTRGVDTIVLVGGSTHVGIAATAYGARDRDLHVVVARDGCSGREPQRSFFLDHVFPRMARVRTAADVVAMLDRGGAR